MRRSPMHTVQRVLVMVLCTVPCLTVQAQARRDRASAQAVDSLVARLPGRPVSLSTFVDAALREGFDVQLALMNRRRAEANALYEGRAIDPELHLSSDVAGTPLTNAAALAANQGTTAGMQAALPWGTVLNADYGRTGTLGVARFAGTSEQNRLSIGVSQPLLDGVNQRTAGLRAAQLDRSAATILIGRTRQEIATDIELQYWTLAEAQAVEAVYGRSVDLAKDILRRNAELASRDLIASVDVLTVQSGVAFRESLQAQARLSRRDLSDALVFGAYGAAAAQIVDADTLPVIAIDDTTSRATAPMLDDAIRISLVQRVDLRAVRVGRDAAQVRFAQARNGVLPTVAVTGGWTSLRGSSDVLPPAGGTASAWRLGMSISAPLLNRGDRGLEMLAAVQLEMESLRVRRAEAQVVRDVRAAVRALRIGSERLDRAAVAASLAWEQLTAERRRLELGLGDSFRLLQTEDNAVQAQLEAVRARYDLLRATSRYWLAVGSVRGAS